MKLLAKVLILFVLLSSCSEKKVTTSYTMPGDDSGKVAQKSSYNEESYVTLNDLALQGIVVKYKSNNSTYYNEATATYCKTAAKQEVSFSESLKLVQRAKKKLKEHNPKINLRGMSILGPYPKGDEEYEGINYVLFYNILSGLEDSFIENIEKGQAYCDGNSAYVFTVLSN